MKKSKLKYSDDPFLNEMMEQCLAGKRSSERTAEKLVAIKAWRTRLLELRTHSDVRNNNKHEDALVEFGKGDN